MRIIDATILDGKLITDQLYRKVEYYAGVYFATLRDRAAANLELTSGLLLEGLKESYPTLNVEKCHYVRTDELIVVVDRQDANLKGILEYLREGDDTSTVYNIVPPRQRPRAALDKFKPSEWNEFEPTLRDKLTTVHIANVRRETYIPNWMLNVDIITDTYAVVIDGRIMIECSRPKPIQETE